MNKMAVSLLVLLSAALVSANAGSHSKYPLIMWGQHAFDRIKEIPTSMQVSDAMEIIKERVEGSSTVNVVAVVKEGLTSQELVHIGKKCTFLRSQVQGHSELYSNLQDQFNSSAFEQLFNGTSTYTLQTIEELSALEETLAEQFKESTANPTVIEVIVKQGVSIESFDKIIEQL